MKIFIESDHGTVSHNATRKVVTIGRAESNDMCISHPELSREHCVIFIESNQYYILDKRSKNGVTINGVKIEPETKVLFRPDDVVMLAKNIRLHVTRPNKELGLGETGAIEVDRPSKTSPPPLPMKPKSKK